MKVEVDREEFTEALKRAKEATERKSSLPILGNFLMRASGDRLIIKASDLENYLTLSLRANSVEMEGEVCVSSKSLMDIVKNFSSATVYMETEGEKLTIRGGRSVFKLPTVPPEDFPEFPEPQEGQEVLSGSLMIEGIDRTEYALSKDDTRIALQGMYVRGYEGRIHFVGSDGHRLALYEPEGELSLDLILPRKSLKVIRRLLTGIEEVKLSKDEEESFAFLSSEDWTLGVRLLEGEYPDYVGVIPHEFNAEVLVDTKEMLRALKRLSGISETAFSVKITLSDNLMVLEFAEYEFGEGREEIDVEYLGDTFEIGFNGKYLMEALDAFDSEKVWLKFTTPDTAAIVEADDYEREPYKCIIMPMRV